jgi:hypothetical protein
MSTAVQRHTMPITRNSIRYPGFFTRRRIMFRPIQNPQRPLSHALIVNSRTSFGHPVHNSPIERKSKKANTKGITLPESSALGRAVGCCESSSSKLHRTKCSDGEQVTGDVGSLNAPKRGGRKSGLEQIAHLL